MNVDTPKLKSKGVFICPFFRGGGCGALYGGQRP